MHVREATVAGRNEEKPGQNFQQVVFTLDDIESGDLNGDGLDDVVVASAQGATTSNVVAVPKSSTMTGAP